MKPIYCWKITKDLKLEKYTIENYKLDHWVGGDRYIFNAFLGNEKMSKRYVEVKNFDRFVHQTYYSFLDDDTKAKNAILDSYKSRANRLASELDKVNNIITEIRRNIK